MSVSSSHPTSGLHLASPRVRGQFVTAALLFGLLVPTVGVVMGAAATGLAAALILYGVLAAVAGWAFSRNYAFDAIGFCNLVTLFRLALVSSLAASFFAPQEAVFAVLSVAVTAFLLDGVDGWMARRSGLTSEFGARFDVEVDSVFALLLAGLAVHAGLHPLVILLGLPRYLFGAAQTLWPRLVRPLAPRFSRKVVCVVQIAVLIFLLMPWFDPSLRHGTALLCGGLVLWSFAVDIRAILRTAS